MRSAWRGLLALVLLVACSGGGGTSHVRAERARTSTTHAAPEDTSTTGDQEATTTTPVATTSSSTSPATTTTAPARVRTPKLRLVYMGRPKLEGDDPIDVWSADLDGSDPHVIARAVPEELNQYVPGEVSPDGRRLAYRHAKDGRIHVRRLDAGPDADVAVSPEAAYYGHWFDDDALVFDRAADQSTWTVSSDGKDARPLHPGSVYGMTYDHRVIVRDRSGSQLAVTKQGVATPLTDREAMVLGGKISPDGTHVVWVQASTCRCPDPHLWVGRPDGSEAVELHDEGSSYFGRSFPSWGDDHTVYAYHPESSIDLSTLDGTYKEVIRVNGYWQFLGVLVSR